ncbi:MAG: ATP-binding protein [Albidovulum sp.]|nr:ATP-binding protein [Albidovulum sp.]
MPRAIVADRDSCRSQRNFDRYLARLVDYWRRKQSHRKTLELSDLKKLRNAMRPDVDFFPPFTTRMGHALDQFQQMTKDQYVFLEWVEPNSQIIVTGGAGTGKTFLAVQCARMEVGRGRKVAIVVESPTLAAHIRRMETNPKISVLTLPQAKHLSRREFFDVILVDEGQDMLAIDSISIVSDILVGGLDEGRWRWFMDANKQSHLRGSYDPEVLDLLRVGYGSAKPFEARLSTNVRNTKEIIARVERWTDAYLGETKYIGHGSTPFLVAAETPDDIAAKIAEFLRYFGERQVPLEEIGIIVANRCGEETMRDLEVQFRRELVRLGPATVGAGLKGKAVLGNAAVFKGLERPVVFAVGFDYDPNADKGLNELYVATTRANYGLVVIGSARLINRLKNI